MTFPHRIHTQLSRVLRIEIAGTIVVEAGLLVQLLGVEEVWRIPVAITLLDEDLAIRDVRHVLDDLAIDVGHKCRVAYVVGVISCKDRLLAFSEVGMSTSQR